MKKEEVIAAVRDILDKWKCNYNYHEEEECFTMPVKLDCRFEEIIITFGWAESGLAFAAYSPIMVNRSRFEEMRKYLNMINNECASCFFSLDESGAVDCKCWISTSWLECLPEKAINECLQTIGSVFNRYGDGIIAICGGSSDAETEFEKAETETEEENNEE